MHIIFCSSGDNEYQNHYPLKAITSKQLTERTLDSHKRQSPLKNFYVETIEHECAYGGELTVLSRTSGQSTYVIGVYENKNAARHEMSTKFKNLTGLRADKITVF